MPELSSRDAIGTTRGARAERWQAVVPTALVLLVLVALVLLPFATRQRTDAAREQIIEYADPARSEVTRLQAILAFDGSLVHQYFDVPDSTLLPRYRDAVRQEEVAIAELGRLVGHLDEPTRARYAEVTRARDAWRAAAERALRAASEGGHPADPSRQAEYEQFLIAAARMDQAVGAFIQRERTAIIDAGQTERWTTTGLALAGLIAAAAVAFLARRLQLYASRLEEGRAELERVVEGRARLMRGVSHDLKNPLHAIDGHAALLEEGIMGPLTEAQKDSLKRIRGGVRSSLVLIGDLVELSRVEAGQLPIKMQPVDLAALLRETVEQHRAAAQTAGHELTLSPAGELPEITSDPERLRQVLGNLISNAVKYTPRGGRITVRAERRSRDDSDEWLAVDVVDTGPGIPPDKLETIFDEFARLPNNTGTPGSGLGLAIARRVAKLLGGDLTASNEPQGGARFTLWLPIGRGPSAERH